MTAIAGSGVAALSCAMCLVKQGRQVTLYGTPRKESPSVLLGKDTLGLIAELFGEVKVTQLGHPIHNREIFWAGKKPLLINAPGHAVPLGDLVALLSTSLDGSNLVDNQEIPFPYTTSSEYVIDATGRVAAIASKTPNIRSINFGNRKAITAMVKIRLDKKHTATIEQVDGGWLFLLPISSHLGCIQFIAPASKVEPSSALDRAIQSSSAIKHRIIADNQSNIQLFSSSPKILSQFSGERWIATGDAILAMDPLCGDGIGTTIRSAILASAVLSTNDANSDASSPPTVAALQHYQQRQWKTFIMHLHHIFTYYKSLQAGFSTWKYELESTARFLSRSSITQFLDTSSAYSLSGYTLKRELTG